VICVSIIEGQGFNPLAMLVGHVPPAAHAAKLPEVRGMPANLVPDFVTKSAEPCHMPELN
jgi:hypothetical protein